SHVLQSSGDLRAVQEMLGHASITSTQVYTALDFQHLALVYDKAHPRAKIKYCGLSIRWAADMTHVNGRVCQQ
ncbi:MAG TPA: tyrosine-type recombinase/integrase, partial [Pseudoduganella sp.]